MNRNSFWALVLVFSLPIAGSTEETVLPFKMPKEICYKSDFNGRPEPIRAQGLAIADDPLGPFEKYPLNPVLNSDMKPVYFRSGAESPHWRSGMETRTARFSLRRTASTSRWHLQQA